MIIVDFGCKGTANCVKNQINLSFSNLQSIFECNNHLIRLFMHALDGTA